MDSAANPGIKTINCGGVNCYLAAVGDGYILIDTAIPAKRHDVEQGLRDAGCLPGNVKLIVLTHGDSDHAGNAAHLRETYGAQIAMHTGDAGMVERGDMNWNRKAKPDKFSLAFRAISVFAKLFVRSGRFEVFAPDLTIDEGFDLTQYGLDARILHIPGHSKGSIGVLTSAGDLFCGDLLYNMGKPGTLFIDDLQDFNSSIEKLRSLKVTTVYPGHGKPFSMKRFTKAGR